MGRMSPRLVAIRESIKIVETPACGGVIHCQLRVVKHSVTIKEVDMADIIEEFLAFTYLTNGAMTRTNESKCPICGCEHDEDHGGDKHCLERDQRN